MKKLAIFVEGQTEQIFVNRLLLEIAGGKNVSIEQQKAKKDRNGKRYFTTISASSMNTGQKYYVLIRDCGGESTVKTDIVDACESLANQGYEKILGLRDVCGQFSYADIPKLEAGLRYKLPIKYVPIHILLAVMEVEAWFLAETSHFVNIHPTLSADYIRSKLGLDLLAIDLEKRERPSQDLDDIYHLVGIDYTKNRSNVQRTVSAMDYEALYFTVRRRVPRLNTFVEHIDSFLS